MMSGSNPSQGDGSTLGDVEAANQPQGEKADRPVSSDNDVVGWDSLDDPENPRNWPSWKKTMHIALLGVLTLNA